MIMIARLLLAYVCFGVSDAVTLPRPYENFYGTNARATRVCPMATAPAAVDSARFQQLLSASVKTASVVSSPVPVDGVKNPGLNLLQVGEKKRRQSSCPTSTDALTEHYNKIFPTGNRNAASFKWFTYIAKCAPTVGEETFEALGKGFCPVSGSPIGGDNAAKVTLGKVGGGTATGLFFFCCDPCVCDMVDLVRVDTKTVNSKQYNVLVHGDPCKNKEKLGQNYTDPFSGASESILTAAPEVQCEGDELKGATKSDQGHPIIGLFFPESATPESGSLDGTTDNTQKQCALRAKSGYTSGMGLLFRKVAEITPL